MKNIKEYIEKFSEYICTVNSEKETFGEIEAYFSQNPICEDGLVGRVWILIGKDHNEAYYSLMVAQSENIKEEIVADVSAMLNLEYKKQKNKQREWSWNKEIRYNLDVIQAPQIAKINSNGNTYLFQKGHSRIKSQYLYRYLMKQYKEMRFYEVDIDLYLKVEQQLKKVDIDVYNVYDMGKDYYVESKLAVETGSLFWNYYKSGVGKRAYYYFRNKK